MLLKRIVTSGWLGLSLAALTAPACHRTEEPKPTIEAQRVVSPTWTLGSSYVYALSLQSQAKVDSEEAPLDFALSAKLELQPLRVSGQEIEFGVVFAEPRFSSQRPDPDGNFAKLSQELSSAALFTVSSGRLSELHLRPDLSTFAGTIARTVFAALQFPADAPRAASWTVEEVDATGRYTAEYRPGAERGRLSKKKLSYAPIPPSKLLAVSPLGGGVDTTPKVEASSGEVVLEANGRLSRLSQNETIAVKLMGATPVVSETHLTLALERQEPAGARDWDAVRGATLKATPGQPLMAKADSEANFDETKIGDLTFEKALSELEAVESDPRNKEIHSQRGDQQLDENERSEREAQGREQARVFTGLAAMFRHRPETIQRALLEIKKGSPADKALLDALASSRSALGEAALIDLVTGPKVNRELRLKAAASLIRVRQPSDEAVTALTALLDDPVLDVHANFGLGTYARRLREASELERSDAISRKLVERLSSVKSDSARLIVLRAIANSAYLAALPALRPYLTNDNASLRLGAVQALRLMDHPDVPGLIAERLNDDKASKVRIGALEAAGRKSLTPVLRAAVERVASSAPDAMSRMNAVQLLLRWSREHPEVRESLALVAKNEREPKIRDVAQQALGL